MALSDIRAPDYRLLRRTTQNVYVSTNIERRSTIDAQICAASIGLVLVATAILAFGMASSMMIVDERNSMGHTPEGSPIVCFDAERHRSHTLLRIHAGSNPVQAYSILVRVDTAVACESNIEGIRIVLTSARALGSRSLICHENGNEEGITPTLTALCADVILAGNRSSSMTANRAYVAAIRLGAPNLAGTESTAIEVDGELQLCYGTRMVMGGARACFMTSDVDWKPSLPTLYTMPIWGANNWLYTNLSNVCPTPSSSESEGNEFVPNPLFPSSVVLQSQWSKVIFASEATTLVENAYRSARDHGLSCMYSGTPSQQRVAYAIQAACNTLSLGFLDRAASLLCADQPSLGYEEVAAKDFALSLFKNQSGTLVVWEDYALDGIASRSGQNDDQTALDTSLYRLGVMILAALVMWTRKEDRSSHTDSIFIRCIELLYHQDDKLSTADIPHHQDESLTKHHVDTPMFSRILGLISIGARFTMTFAMRRRLSAEGLQTLVICEFIASGASLIHWLQLHVIQCAGDILDRRPMIGGSAAVVDIACATMITFADTPLTDSGDNFDDIARLLTAMLITMACVTRTVFSTSCSISGVIPSASDPFGIQHSVESTISVFYWIYQSAETVHVLLRLFVIPFSITLAHRGTTNPSFASMAIFVGLLGIGACPRLTANANSIIQHLKEHREDAKTK